MDNLLNTFDGLEKSNKIMGLLSQNQMDITNNLANVHTPNYIKKNSNFHEVLSTMRSPMLTDLAKKVGPCPIIKEEGGKVVLETELSNMQMNFLYYNLALRRAGSLINIIKAVGQTGR
jgi:flagellar basal body rod protein FlgB